MSGIIVEMELLLLLGQGCVRGVEVDPPVEVELFCRALL